MTFEGAAAWAIASIIGALAGLGVGHLSGVSHRRRFIPIGIFVGLGVLRVAGVPPYGPAQSDIDAVDERLVQSAVYSQIKSDYPADYKQFVARLASTPDDLSDAGMERQAQQFAADIRIRDAIYIRQASDEAIIDFIAADLSLITAISERLGSEKCAEYLSDPSAFQKAHEAEFSSEIEAQSLALLDLLKDGKSRRDYVAPASDEDWQALTDYLYADGDLASNPDHGVEPGASTTDPCGKAVSFAEAALDFKGDAARRVRKEMAYQAASTPWAGSSVGD